MKRIVFAAALGAAMFGAQANAATTTVAFSENFNSGVPANFTTNASCNTGQAGIFGRLCNNSAFFTFNSPGPSGLNAATLQFTLLGFDSIDGTASCCQDTFNLTVNGTNLFSASFRLGGAGNLSTIFSNPTGASATVTDNGFFQGGNAVIVVPFTLLGGANSFEFNYGGLQGLGDESFGLDNVSISARVTTSAVPEPTTWAMMIGGFGLVGGAMRSSRRRTKVSFAA